MTTIYLSPDWFDPFSIMFECFFFIVTFALALMAFRIKKLTGDRNAGFFFWGFLLISLAYLVQGIFNFLIIINLPELFEGEINIYTIAILAGLGTYLHILLMVLGLSLLLMLALHAPSAKALILLAMTSLIGIILSRNELHAFYLVSSLFVIILTWHFFENYFKKKDAKILLVAIGFLLLFLGRIDYFFGVTNEAVYVAANFLELFAYLFLLANFYLVFKK